MTDLIPFNYEGVSVRTITVDGESEFVAADVCRVLDHSNPSVAVAGLDDDERGLRNVETPSGEQQMVTVTEAGLYSLIIRSRKAEAKAFRRWITHTVLPQIRRTGVYSPATQHEINASIFQARAQMELCQAAKGLIHPDHLEAKARVVLARGLGEHAELDTQRRPLYTQDYLKGKGISTSKLKSIGGVFGKRVKAAYVELHGVEPEMYPLTLTNGQTRMVRGYTEADRPLLDQVWAEKFGGAA